MASLKSKTLGYLASGNGQNSTSRLTTDQNNNFWKTVAQPAAQAQANPGGQQSDPADTESNKTYTVNGKVSHYKKCTMMQSKHDNQDRRDTPCFVLEPANVKYV